MKVVRNFAIPLSAVAALLPAVVYATNGMNLEGYGPIATAMGGRRLNAPSILHIELSSA